MSTSASCTLYALVATDADVAVIFRRGPSKAWHIARWDLKTFKLESGAWFRGTLYPRRCEISPDGKLLGYFAHAARPFDEWQAYFAVSKVPWLTALAAWRTLGTWTTGCRFGADGALTIDSRCFNQDNTPFHGSFPFRMIVPDTDASSAERAFQNERARGWVKAGERTEAAVGNLFPRRKVTYPYERIVLARRGSRTKTRLVLVSDGVSFKRPAIEGVDVRYGVERPDGTIETMPWTWADWSHRGEILAATKDGRLVAMKLGAGELEQIAEHDLSSIKPRKTFSPEWAREW